VSIRVLIADDDALTRAALRTIIDAHDDIELVGEASDGLEAIERAAELHPDVLLLDIRMPNLDGLEAARQVLASKGKRPRVIMLTTFDLTSTSTKHSKPERPASCGKTRRPSGCSRSYARRAPAPPYSIRRSRDASSSATARRRRDKPRVQGSLNSRREVEVLREVARGQSNAEIAAQMYLSEATGTQSARR